MKRMSPWKRTWAGLSLPFAVTVAGLALAAVLAGCGGEKAGSDQANGTAVSDTSAYRAALAEKDTTARIAALETFLKEYPQSPFRPNAVSQGFGLLMNRDPARAGRFVDDLLAKEKDEETRGRLYYAAYIHARDTEPGAVPALLERMQADEAVSADGYNMVAWDLVIHEQHLDPAIALAAKGATKAPDDESKSSILDTQGWGLYMKGDYGPAAEILEQAAALISKENAQEVRGHLAQAYDKAGRAQEARDLMVELMTEVEDPEMRAAIERLTRQLGEDPAQVATRIDEARAANAKPAADFTLKNYDGQPVSLSDFKGKVVLLNFWHPT